MSAGREFKTTNYLHTVGSAIMYQILKDFEPIDIIQLYNNPTRVDYMHEVNMRRIKNGEPIQGFLMYEDCVPNNTQILYNVNTILNDLIYNKIVPIIKDDPEYTQVPNMFIGTLPFYVYYSEEKLNIYNMISYYEYLCSFNIYHAGSLTYGSFWNDNVSPTYVQDILKMFYTIYALLLEKPEHNTIKTNFVHDLIYTAHFNTKRGTYSLNPFEEITHHVQWGSKDNYILTMNEREDLIEVLIVPDIPVLKKYTIQDLKLNVNFSNICKPYYSNSALCVNHHKAEFEKLRIYKLHELPKSLNTKINQFLKATSLNDLEFLSHRKHNKIASI